MRTWTVAVLILIGSPACGEVGAKSGPSPIDAARADARAVDAAARVSTDAAPIDAQPPDAMSRSTVACSCDSAGTPAYCIVGTCDAAEAYCSDRCGSLGYPTSCTPFCF